MPTTPLSINLDRMVDAMLDTRTPHYWDPKRGKLIRGAGELDDEKGKRVLLDTIGNRKFKKMIDGFLKLLDTKDAKLIADAVKGSPDKFNKLLQKRPDLKKEWVTHAGRELTEMAIDWLAMQGVEEFVATGDMARFAAEIAVEAAEAEEADEDDDEESEEEAEEEAEGEEEPGEEEEEEEEEGDFGEEGAEEADDDDDDEEE